MQSIDDSNSLSNKNWRLPGNKLTEEIPPPFDCGVGVPARTFPSKGYRLGNSSSGSRQYSVTNVTQASSDLSTIRGIHNSSDLLSSEIYK
jgi:hypothetical protein